MLTSFINLVGGYIKSEIARDQAFENFCSKVSDSEAHKRYFSSHHYAAYSSNQCQYRPWETVCDISCAEQIKTMRYCMSYLLYIEYHYKRIVKYHYICDVISVSQVQQKKRNIIPDSDLDSRKYIL